MAKILAKICNTNCTIHLRFSAYFHNSRSEHNKKFEEYTAEHEIALNTMKEHDEKYEEITKQRIEKEDKIKEEMV